MSRAVRDPSYNDVPSLLRVRHLGKALLINPDQVYKIIYKHKVMELWTEQGLHATCDCSLTFMMERFPGLWIRASRNLLVKRNSIAHVYENKITLTNGDTVHCSRRQLAFLSSRSLPLDRDNFKPGNPKCHLYSPEQFTWYE